MSEKIKSDGISRRSVFLLFGLAAAEKTGPERRHERREHCRERRQERHEHRSERREERRTGADAKK